METVRNVEANAATAQECCAPAAKSGWSNPRNLLIGVALAGGAGAMGLGWDWLVAAGVASIIIVAAPCLVMCALGLCMHRMSKDQTAGETPPVTPGTGIQAMKAEPATPPMEAQAVKVEPVSEPNMPAPGNRV